MSEPLADLPATITAIGTLVAALGALLISFRNSQKADDARVKAALAAEAADVAAEAARSAKAEIVTTRNGVFEVGKQIDGRLSELLKLTKESAMAEGRLQGRAEMSPPLPPPLSAAPAATPAPEPPNKPPQLPDEPVEVRVVQDPEANPLRVKDVRQ